MFVPLIILFAATLWGNAAERSLLETGRRAFREAEWEGAVEIYRDFSARYPESPYRSEARLRLGICLYKTGAYEGASRVFKALAASLSAQPQNLSHREITNYWLGISLAAEGDYPASLEILEKGPLPDDAPYREQADYYRGLALKEGGDWPRALSLWGAILKEPAGGVDPALVLVRYGELALENSLYEEYLLVGERFREAGIPPGLRRRINLQRGEALLKLGRGEEAAAHFQSLLDRPDPLSETAFHRLYRIAVEAEDAAALQLLRGKLYEIWEDSPGALLRIREIRGFEAYLAGRPSEAADWLTAAWDNRHGREWDGRTPLYLADIYLQQGRREAALDILSAAAGGPGRYAGEAALRAAQILIQDRRWERALQILGPLPEGEVEPSLLFDYRLLAAYAAFRAGDPRQARELIAPLEKQDWSGPRDLSLSRISGRILSELGRYGEAAQRFRFYLESYPDEQGLRQDYLLALFQNGDYDEVLEQSVILKRSPELPVIIPYLAGLAALQSRDYRRALSELEEISYHDLGRGGESPFYPYILYNRGWALYRLGHYRRAVTDFNELMRRYPLHSLSRKATYLAGWSWFLMGNNEEAADSFLKAVSLSDSPGRGKFMYARSLSAMGRQGEALIQLEELVRENPEPDILDNALFLQAAILQDLGDDKAALAVYDEIFRLNRTGPFAEEGVFRRGEILLSSGEPAAAAEAFSRYRDLYPDGQFADASLYWQGMALQQAEQPLRALLLWELLIEKWPESVFHPEALYKTGQVYRESQRWEEALMAYNDYMALYPEKAAIDGVPALASQLRYQVGGTSGREAELSVVITREGGAGSPEGRQAMLELARFYLAGGQGREDEALRLLQKVVAFRDAAPRDAAAAHKLMGDARFQSGQYRQAARDYLTASTLYPSDRELTGLSLFRAMEMYLYLERAEEAREVYDRIKTYFPDSVWLKEAEEVLKETANG